MNLALTIKNAISNFKNNHINTLSSNDSGIIVPEWLKRRKINDNDTQFLLDFFNSNEINYFSEITADIINDYGSKSYESAIKVCNLLGLYGVQFLGRNSKKYSFNSSGKDVIVKSFDSQESIYNLKFINSHIDFVMNRENEIKIFNFLKAENIYTIKQLNGIHLGVVSGKTNLNMDLLEELFLCANLNVLKNDNDIKNFYNNTISCKINVSEEKFVNSYEQDDLTIEHINFSTRTYNVLKANNVKSISKLKILSEDDILSFKNAGQGTLKEINEKIQELASFEPSKDSSYEDSDLSIKNQQEYLVDKETYEKSFSELIIENRILNSLNKSALFKIGDIIDYSENELKSIEGLGSNSIIELKKVLEDYGINLKNKYILSENVLDDRYFNLLCDTNLSLEAKNLFEKFDVKNVGQLLEVFPDEFYKDDDFCSSSTIFKIEEEIKSYLSSLGFNEYPVKFSKVQKDKLNEPTLSELLCLNISELILKQMRQFEEKYIISLDELKKLIYENRIKATEKLTLQELGEQVGVTRERIRQIEKKLKITLTKAFNEKCLFLNNISNKLFNEFGDVIHLNNLDINNDYLGIIQEFINDSTYFRFKIDFNNKLLMSKQFDFESFISSIIDSIESLNKNIVCLNDINNVLEQELVQYFNNKADYQRKNYSDIEECFLNILLQNHFIKLDENNYKFKKSKKRNRGSDRDEKLFYFFEKLYPNGVHLPINNDEQLEENLTKLIESVPQLKKFCIRGIIDNKLKSSKNILLWGKGLYIHINNISPDWNIVDTAISDAIALFDKGITEFKIHKLFTEDESKFINAGIPNYNALWSLMKYKENPRLRFKRLEIYDANLNQDKRDLLEIFDEFIKTKKEFISKDELKKYFCEERGWKDYQLDLLLGRSEKVVKMNNHYIHLDNLAYSVEELENISKATLHKIEITEKTIHLRKIKEEYGASWYSVCKKDISPELMGTLLSKQIILPFCIERKVYAKPLNEQNSAKSQEITFVDLISSWIKEQSEKNKFVTNKEIYEYCEKQGFNGWNAINTAKKAGMLEYYNNSFVHPDVIGYSDEILEDLIELSKEVASEVYEKQLPYIKFELILETFKERLPSLNDGYEWTAPLLASVLSKINHLEVFKGAFIFKENPFKVEDLDDVCAYILAKNISTRICKVKKMQNLLKRENIIGIDETINNYRQELFAEGSSVELVDDDNNVMLSKIGRERYKDV